MKKTVSLILALVIVLLFAGCAGAPAQSPAPDVPSEAPEAAAEPNAPEEAPSDAPDAEEGGILVVYFSVTGNTGDVAARIAALTGADLKEIVPAQPYTEEDINYYDFSSRAVVEQYDPDSRPEIAEDISTDGYTTLYLGYPIWCGAAPRIMSTFVESCDLTGVTVIPFCTSGSSDIGLTDDTLATQAGSGNWLQGKRFAADVSDGELSAWLDGLGQ